MKSKFSFKIVASVFVLTFSVMIFSCKKDGKFFKKDINTDPNQLVSMNNPSSLLTNAELTLAFTQGGDLSRYSGILTQQCVGALNQFIPYNNYTFSPTDFDNCWSNLYASDMNNLNQIMLIADKNKLHAYKGIAEILMAYSITLTSDMWGDVPFSKAFLGLDNKQPTYDKGNSIYAASFKLINDGISNLTDSAALANDKYTPSGDDFIYNGHSTQWVKFAHALKAKLYLHQYKIYPAGVDSALTIELPKAFASGADDAMFPFSMATNGNPNSQFNWNDRGGYIDYLGSTIYSWMHGKSDPRLGLWIDTTNDIVGTVLGPTLDAGGNIINNGPVYFMSFAEQKFIEAELNNYKSNPLAANNYNDAITASFTMAGIPSAAATYITANPCPASGTAQLQAIMYEKYIALFTHPEVWTDIRRTGYPVLTPSNASFLTIPNKFLYPQEEIFYNGSNVPSSDMKTKIWWQ